MFVCRYCHSQIKEPVIQDELMFCNHAHLQKFLADELSHQPKVRLKNKRKKYRRMSC